MSSHFFAFLSRMKYINRWGLMRNTNLENIAEHSLQVAIIAHALAEIKNIYFNGDVDPYKVATLAIYHDADEIITGDMPTPIKYYSPAIIAAYKDVENIAKKRLLSMLPLKMQDKYNELFFKKDEDLELWEIVKAADKISAYIKCIEEMKAGNGEFNKAAESTRGIILSNPLPEVEFFMENFMESFSLTLDEQE